MLNTEDIGPKGKGGLTKNLLPGNVVCKINSVYLEEYKYKPGSLFVVLNLEGPELKDFEGFYIDKNNPSLGRHKGQVANVKTDQYAYDDGVTKGGQEVKKVDKMLSLIKNICVALDIEPWLKSQHNKHETIESLYAAFNRDKPFAGKTMEFCLAGMEYTNKNGYKAYELFLPKYSKAGAAFGKNVVKFDPAIHIKQKNKEKEKVTEFGNNEASNNKPASTANSDFQLD